VFVAEGVAKWGGKKEGKKQKSYFAHAEWF
jgi:hypothetical protein